MHRFRASAVERQCGSNSESKQTGNILNRKQAMNNPKIRNNIHNHRKLAELMTTSPMSAEVHAAVQRHRTEVRRMIEDIKFAAQSADERFRQ